MMALYRIKSINERKPTYMYACITNLPEKKHVILGADNSLWEQIGQQITHQIKQQSNSVQNLKNFFVLIQSSSSQ